MYSAPMDMKEWFWVHRVSVFLFVYVCMHMRLAVAWTSGGFYSYSVFKSLLFIGLCPVNMNIAASILIKFP
jgi:hypothetical protein